MQLTSVNKILLAFLFLVPCISTINGHMVQSNFRAPADRNFLLENANMALVRSRSLLDCARQCFQHHSCASFDFEKKSGDLKTSQCRLKTLASSDSHAVITSSSSFVHYDLSPASGGSPGSKAKRWVKVIAATHLSSLMDGIIVLTPQLDILMYASLDHLSSGPAAIWNLSHFLEDWSDKKVNDLVQKDSMYVPYFYVFSESKVHCMTIEIAANFAITPCNGPTYLGIPTWQVDTIGNVLGPGFPADMDAYTEITGVPYVFKKSMVYTTNGSYSINSSNPDNIWHGIPAGYTAISRTAEPELYLVFANEDYFIHNISDLKITYQGKVAGL